MWWFWGKKWEIFGWIDSSQSLNKSRILKLKIFQTPNRIQKFQRQGWTGVWKSDSGHLWLPTRTTVTRKNATLHNHHPGQLPPKTTFNWKTATQATTTYNNNWDPGSTAYRYAATWDNCHCSHMLRCPEPTEWRVEPTTLGIPAIYFPHSTR